jgi:hypothetical protein
VLIVGGALLALALTGSATFVFAAVAIGIGVFGAGVLAAMRTRFRRLRG